MHDVAARVARLQHIYPAAHGHALQRTGGYCVVILDGTGDRFGGEQFD
jgi:hypothetical protein